MQKFKGSFSILFQWSEIIALGLLIDNGIIVVEDYKYRRSKGLSIRDSINETLIQLTTPLAAATGTTVFAFMPIVTGDGSSIEFVGGLAVTVIMLSLIHI